MVRSNGSYQCKWINLYSHSSAFILALHWSSDGVLSLNIFVKNIPICCKISSNEKILVRLRGLWSKILYVYSSSLLYERRWRCKISDPGNPLNSLQLWKSAVRWKLHHPWLIQVWVLPYKSWGLSEDKISLFQLWLHLFCHLILVFHQACFSPCPPLRSLNFLDLLPPFTLCFQGDFLIVPFLEESSL